MLKLEDLRLSLASVSSPRTKGGNAYCPPGKTIRGVYLWGAAARGKAKLMDLFFGTARTDRKSRMHFHEFMAGVHSFIHEWREKLRNGAVKGDDPIAAAADSIAQRTWLLCFDEFSVTDIADAMILGRLFSALFVRGVVIVATSYVRPDLFYQDGLNRTLFLPFIAMIEAKMEAVQLNARDFRLEKLGDQLVYFSSRGQKRSGSAYRSIQILDRG